MNAPRFPILAAAAAVALAGAPALAQPPGGGGSGPQQSDLPQLLHLRPDQMQAFHNFQAASRPTSDELNQLRGASPQTLSGLPTPQRLDRLGAMLGAEMGMFRRSADATRAFYGQLSPDQQQTFDRVSGPPQGRGQSR